MRVETSRAGRMAALALIASIGLSTGAVGCSGGGSGNGGPATIGGTQPAPNPNPNPNPAPMASVDTVSPALASSAGGTTITISTSTFGDDFTVTPPVVTVGGLAATVTPLSPTSVTAVVPAQATATVNVTVMDTGASASFTTFQIVAPVGANDLIINEVLPDPGGLDVNNDGAQSNVDDEFVEIVNTLATPVDITGYSIRDAVAEGNGTERHVFPNPTTIPAGGSIIVFGSGTPTGFAAAQMSGAAQASSSGTLSLNNAGDDVRIKDPTRAIDIDFATYGASQAPAGESLNRAVDGQQPAVLGQLTRHTLAETTLGAADAVGNLSPGLKVDQSTFP